MINFGELALIFIFVLMGQRA